MKDPTSSVGQQSGPGCVVVALGGNAITAEGQAGTYDEMMANCRVMAKALWQLIDDDWRVVLTHGNGPQVGNMSIQQNAAANIVPELPLHAIDAMTQGLLGHLISLAIQNESPDTHTGVASIVTHVVVDPEDPAFANPTKPIGPFYSIEDGAAVSRRFGWTMVEDAGRGMRRTVPSPLPKSILEISAIKSLARSGSLVIAAGGGGIPVDGGGQVQGVEAVIDKDRSAGVLASELEATALVLVTGIEAVQVDYGTPAARSLHDVTASELSAYADQGQFPPGSMGPKVEAAVSFVRSSGGTAVITSAECMVEALRPGSLTGTRVVADPA